MNLISLFSFPLRRPEHGRHWLPLLCLLTVLPLSGAASGGKAIEPADPDLIPEARRVLEYLREVKGDGVLAGGPSRVQGGPGRPLHRVGREPAIRHLASNFFLTPAMAPTTRDAAIHWWRDRGGLILAMNHWHNPMEGAEDFHDQVDLAKVLSPGTEEYRRFHERLGVIADYLHELAGAGVPILWAPQHEIDGGWFWWTDDETPENTAALWRQTFEYLVNERGIHNLIWVYQAAHVSHASRNRIRREHGRTPTLEEEVAWRRRFYPGDDYVDIVSISTYGNRNFYPDWGWGQHYADSRPGAYELLSAIAPGPAANGMLAIGESPGMVNPFIFQREGPAWLWSMTWYMGDAAWDRFAWNHDHYITLEEMPVLHEGNVRPNVRIAHPLDGVETHGRRLHLHGTAVDRNDNLERVSIHALSGLWRLWSEMPGGIEYVDAHAAIFEALGEETFLGEAELEPNGRWSFTWENPPAGFINVVALARDAEGAVASSNVVRLSVDITNLARGMEATASIHQEPHVASGAVDDDLFDGWWAGVPRRRDGTPVVQGPQWLQVDLGTVQSVGAATVHWWRARASHYAVQVSRDGEKWRDVAKVEGGGGEMDVHRFRPVKARYLRLYCTEHAVDWQTYCVFDFGVYASLPEAE